jgi:hypothetical protein
MNPSDTENEVVRQVLESFQHVLGGLRGGLISRMFMGNAPSEGFARQLSSVDIKGRITGSVLGLWRVSSTEIVVLPDSFTIPAIGRGAGRYYDRGSFDFVVAQDGANVVVGWQVGPRFGRGFRYQVVTGDGGRQSLKIAETLWIS